MSVIWLQLSPLAQLSWRDGWIALESGSSRLIHRWQGGELLALLDAFAQPAELSRVVHDHPEHDPEELRALLDEFRASGVLVPPSVGTAQRPWEPELEQIDPDQALEAVAELLAGGDLVVEDQGQTVSTRGKASMSPGCQACKDGGWVCAYLGFRCNAACGFCPQPPSRGQRDEAREGSLHVPALLRFVDEHAERVSGLSISGGELFLYLDAAHAVLRHCQARHPDLWLWAYTNGLAATPERVAKLAALGLRELRFNLAASGWSDRARGHVERAVALLPWVTVEVPVTARTHRALLDEGMLDWLAAAGVRQLNLAQLCIPEATPSAPVAKHHADEGPFYAAGGALYSLPSRLRSLEILREAQQRHPALHVNDCSSDAKRLQERARRLRWGPRQAALRRHCWPHPAAPSVPLSPPASAERNDSGLAWQRLRAGHGDRHPGPLDWVRVRSTGWTADGACFDSTWHRADHGQLLPMAQAIPGWSQGVRAMVEGEHRALWVPEPLAYGGAPGRPAGALLFDVELLAIAD